LDKFDGAAAAYSLRKLRLDYNGDAVRVRRSSDNAEQDIGFSGGTLDTNALTSFVGSNDGYVVTWYDQSGNGRDASQSTQGDQPQIVSSGSVLTYQGEPAIKTDVSSRHILLPIFGSVQTEFAIFTLQKDFGASTDAFSYTAIDSNDDGNGLFYCSKEKNYFGERLPNNNHNDYPGDGILTLLHKGGSDGYETYGDGSQESDRSSTSAQYDQMTIGALERSDGPLDRYEKTKFNEVIAYPNTNVSRSDIEQAINDHYNVF
jgi:hypothetical protein